MSNRSLILSSVFLSALVCACIARQSASDGENNGNVGGASAAQPSGSGGGTTITTGVPTTAAPTATALPADSNGLQPIPPERVTSFESAACNGWSVEAEAAPSAIVFVIDVSGTMNSGTDATGDQNKYEATRDALKVALDGLPNNLQVGLTFYPNKSNGGSRTTPADLSPCIDQTDDVPIGLIGAPGSTQRQALLAALDRVVPDPKGATPTHDAFNVARDMLQAMPADLAKYIAILTDGQPTLLDGCYGKAAPKEPEDAQPIIDAVGAANAERGIKTFFVGSPGSEKNSGTGADSRDWLSAAARAGGTATSAACSDLGPEYCHFDMTQSPNFGSALTLALKEIAGKVVVQCLYEVPPAPSDQTIDPAATNLIYGDGAGGSFAILQNGATDCDRGWHFVDNQTKVEICGVTCQQITGNPKASMSLLFGCAAVTTDSPLL